MGPGSTGAHAAQRSGRRQRLNGDIFIFGGWVANTTTTSHTISSVEEYSPTLGIWQEKASMPVSYTVQGAAASGGTMATST